MKRLIVLGDLHSGHRSGLTPPLYETDMDKSSDAPGYLRKQSCIRKGLWKFYTETLADIGPVDYAIIMGDCIEGKSRRTEGAELLTNDLEEQAHIAALALKEIKAKEIYMVRGTPYHVGASEEWENQVAIEISAAKIENEGHYEILGMNISARHYIGNSSSPVSAVTPLKSAQIKQMLWAQRKQQPTADLMLRAHVHRCDYIGTPALGFQGWTCPCLKGLGDRFAIRQMDGLPIDIGMLEVYVKSKGDWGVVAHIAGLKTQAASVIKLK